MPKYSFAPIPLKTEIESIVEIAIGSIPVIGEISNISFNPSLGNNASEFEITATALSEAQLTDEQEFIIQVTSSSPRDQWPFHIEGTVDLEWTSKSTNDQFILVEPFDYVIDLKDKLTYPSAKFAAELGSIFNTSQLEDMVQNYPNPFNSQTQIRYFMPDESFVSIIVYDSLGRKVATIADEQQDIGLHQVTWSGLDDRGEKVSTGIYIYQIRTNNILLSKKMLIIK